MSDKDINKMDFKELRSEVQSLRDELAIMQRKYEDIFNNLEHEIPYINGKYTITEDLTLSGTVKWAMKNSPVKTQYSTDGNEWHDEQISGYKYMRMSFDGGQTWTNATQVVGKDGSSTSVTFARVNAALGNLFKTWNGGTPTTITGSYIFSPSIKGGEIYGCAIYAGSGEGSFADMTGTGLDVYVQLDDESWARKIGIGYYSGNHDYPYMALGAGTDEKGTNAGCVYKLGRGLWIGDASIVEAGGNCPGGKVSVTDISDTYYEATGIFIDLEHGIIWQYNNGTPQQI